MNEKNVARGRNGWFKIDHIEVTPEKGVIAIDAYSKTVGQQAPVILCLLPKDALKLCMKILIASVERLF